MHLARISKVISTLSTTDIQAYREGHSLERAHQLACADRMASEMLGHSTNIYRDEHGGPHLPDVIERVTISHTGDHMAMLISNCRLLALDIELLDRDIERIVPRFTNAEEIELLKKAGCMNPSLFVWSIKECLFKAVPVQGVLIKEHFKVISVEGKDTLYTHCSVEHPELSAHLTVVSRIFEPLIVSYIDQPTYGYEKI